MAHGCCSRCRKDARHKHPMGICTCTHEPYQPYASFQPKQADNAPVTRIQRISDLASPKIAELMTDRETAEELKDDPRFIELVRDVGMYGVQARIMENMLVAKSILLKYSDGSVRLLIHSPEDTWHVVTVYAGNRSTTLSTFGDIPEDQPKSNIDIHNPSEMQVLREFDHHASTSTEANA